MHRANAPTLIPVPSLLRSLLSEHLDPGYAAAAAQRSAGAQPRSRLAAASWQVLAALAIATVFAFAVAQAQATAPGVRESQQVLSGSVRSAQEATNSAATRRNALAGELDAERRSRLEGDERGRQLLGSLDGANFSAAATAVTGPGLTVTLTDPGASKDLSDVSKERVEGSRQVILDRDLQLVVNSLWASGAEVARVTQFTQRAQQNLRRPLVGSALVDRGQRPLHPRVGVGEQHVLLAREVREEGAGADVCGGRDVGDRGAFVPAPREQLRGGVDQRLPGADAFALTQ